MVVALEAIDLGVLMCVLILIGLLIGVRYTFSRLASVFDVSIPLVGRPFAGIGSAIENVIVGGCNDGISTLQQVATDLWHWSDEALKLALAGLDDFVGYVGSSLHWLNTHGIPAAIHLLLDPVGTIANDAKTAAEDAAHAVAVEVGDRRHAIANAVDTVETWARGELGTLKQTILGEALADFPQVQRDVQALVDGAVSGVEHATNLTASTLSGAAEQAFTNAERAGKLTADELRRLLGKLNPVDVAALIASIPLLKAAVDALEADTGLGNQECRQKVKGICSTPLSSWENLIAGLLLTAEVSNLGDLLSFFEDAARLIVGEIEPFFRAA